LTEGWADYIVGWNLSLNEANQTRKTENVSFVAVRKDPTIFKFVRTVIYNDPWAFPGKALELF